MNECNMSEAEAKEQIRISGPMELEIYYHYNWGLFAVEAEAIDAGAKIYSPYTTEQYKETE